MIAAARRHVAERWPELVATVAVLGTAFVADVVIVQAGHTSISARTWDACDRHPLIAVAGFAAGLIPAYLTRRSWPCACTWFGVAVHLFTFVGAR